MTFIGRLLVVLLALILSHLSFFRHHVALAWEPTKPIEFVIPAGTGGGADQMARLISGVAEKHKLSPRPLIAVNKSGGAGAEGFLQVPRTDHDSVLLYHSIANILVRISRQAQVVSTRADVHWIRCRSAVRPDRHSFVSCPAA